MKNDPEKYKLTKQDDGSYHIEKRNEAAEALEGIIGFLVGLLVLVNEIIEGKLDDDSAGKWLGAAIGLTVCSIVGGISLGKPGAFFGLIIGATVGIFAHKYILRALAYGIVAGAAIFAAVLVKNILIYVFS